MAEPFLGEIRIFAFNFAPTGWALCNGQTLSISQNTALFALLGTTYGGDGITTFNLPNLQSRVPLSQGQGSGLSPYTIGQIGGSESVTISDNQMPVHTHLVNAVTTTANNVNSPSGAYLSAALATIPRGGSGPSENITTYSTATPSAQLNKATIAPAGGGQATPNIQPYLCLNFCIALAGIFPSRN